MQQIRPLLERDLTAVLGLWELYCAELTGSPLAGEDEARILQVLAHYPGHSDTSAWVAEQDSRIVGFGLGFVGGHPVMEGRVGQVEELFVVPECRRDGIASQLVQHMVEDLSGRGAWTFRANVNLGAESALRFWKAQGWSVDQVEFTHPVEVAAMIMNNE